MSNQKGFTLLELLVTVAIVGILSAIAIPTFNTYRRQAKAGATAAEMRSVVTGFYAYLAAYGDWPEDSHLTLPAGMEDFIDPSVWSEETPLGGNYNWEGPSNGFIGIALFNPTAPAEDIERLDALLDDGNLGTGIFRTSTKGRPTWFFDEL